VRVSHAAGLSNSGSWCPGRTDVRTGPNWFWVRPGAPPPRLVRKDRLLLVLHFRLPSQGTAGRFRPQTAEHPACNTGCSAGCLRQLIAGGQAIPHLPNIWKPKVDPASGGSPIDNIWWGASSTKPFFTRELAVPQVPEWNPMESIGCVLRAGIHARARRTCRRKTPVNLVCTRSGACQLPVSC
jgi:hypothetical protein